ncbi:KilA-N domain-containing protein [Salmonella enterica subsp. enterica]|nr:KilA-N domain-containing protein [Salmonella enterica subsp. enterica serovar Hessarek]
MTKAKTLSLFWNNTLHTIVPNDDGMYSLNELHRAAGGIASKRPNEWLRYSKTTDLIEELSRTGFPVLVVRNGGKADTRGTWAIEELVYAYASWLSAEFYKAIIDAFTAAVHGDMVKVREIVRTAVRQEGVPIRNTNV